MPSHLKKLVAARMEKTGESHQQALRQVRAQEDRLRAGAPNVGIRQERLARSRVVADTAFSIARVRAQEGSRGEGERLFEDPYAHMFAAVDEQTLESTQRYLDLPFFYDGVRLRTRFIDDAVRDGLAAGLRQLVLLGAGFDARGLRMPEIRQRRARVYEVDTGEQLSRKRKMLSAGKIEIPASVAYVPFDFDADFETALSDALVKKGFRPHAGALFVWEGVIGYIGSDEIDRSLRFMASIGGPRSRVVFTYAESTFDPESAAECTRRAGFTTCEEVAADELWRRYLGGEPYEHAHVMKIAIATV
ncbi:MAG: SAM-dependent methyltransferase [Polyangiaceae bacterium]|nr:SAM-dependent methyltransferase [Polyangiaceae bacterium]